MTEQLENRLKDIAWATTGALLIDAVLFGNLLTYTTGESKYGLIGTGIGIGLSTLSALGYAVTRALQKERSTN